MSSYLTFYLQPIQEGAEAPKEPMPLMAYSRSSNVYQTMREELAVAYAGEKCAYSEITVSDMQHVLKTQRNEINRTKRYITSARKTLKSLPDRELIREKSEIIEQQEEYVIELESDLQELQHIAYLVESVEDNKSWASFSKVVANID